MQYLKSQIFLKAWSEDDDSDDDDATTTSNTANRNLRYGRSLAVKKTTNDEIKRLPPVEVTYAPGYASSSTEDSLLDGGLMWLERNVQMYHVDAAAAQKNNKTSGGGGTSCSETSHARNNNRSSQLNYTW